MDELKITPEKIRGYGNIIDPKTSNDYSSEDIVTETTVTINDNEVNVIKITKQLEGG